MKKFIINCLVTFPCLLLCLISNAQSNNPFNSFGQGYFESVDKIVQDIQANGFLGNDEVGLNHYLSLCSVDAQINPSLAGEVYNIANAGGTNFVDFLNSVENVSQESKDFSIQIVQNLDNLPLEDKMTYYIELVEQINSSSISEQEQEINLKLISIAVYAYQNNLPTAEQNANTANRESGACTVIGPDGSGSVGPTECVLLAAGVGFYLGYSACGWMCGAGAAIVFGVLAAIAVC